MMYAAFCADPLNPRQVEPIYEIEATCASEAGFKTIVIDHDELDHRVVPEAALRGTKITEAGTFIYRGWMLRSEAYEQLYNALLAKELRPLTSPSEYEACHHAPNCLANLREFTPEIRFLVQGDLDDNAKIDLVLDTFGSDAIVIKDWVKSQASGYWSEACYIEDASNRPDAYRKISRFRELQGDSLVGGVIFKKYVPLKPVGAPAHEFRAFVINGEAIGCWPRSSEASEIGAPPRELIDRVASALPSPFASADFSIDRNGKWWLLEVGDGQVSGLPTPDAAPQIFAALAEALSD